MRVFIPYRGQQLKLTKEWKFATFGEKFHEVELPRGTIILVRGVRARKTTGYMRFAVVSSPTGQHLGRWKCHLCDTNQMWVVIEGDE